MFVHYIWYQGWEFAPPRVQTRIKENEALWAEAGFDVRIWDQAQIEALIRERHAHLLSWFVSLQTTIAKCDVARGFILEALGGIYADCDFDPEPDGVRRFMTEALENKKVLFPGQRPFGLNNYLIAAPPNSPFWIDEYVPAVKKAFETPRLLDLIVGVRNHTWPVMTSTGPVILSRLVSKSKHAMASKTLANTWGRHGWFDSDKNSAWYINSVSKTQQYVVDTVLFLAAIGLLSLIWFGFSIYKHMSF